MKTKLLLIEVAFLLSLTFLLTSYSFAQGIWTRKADVPGNRFYAASFSIGDKGYIGIESRDDPSKDFWEWDQTTDTWTRKADFPGDFYFITACFSIGKKGYIITDMNAYNSSTNKLWEFDPETNTWNQKSSLPSTASIVAAVGFSIGTKGYVGTGARAEDFMYPFTSEFWEWDQATDTWNQKADFEGIVRTGAVGFSIGEKGYIGTGFNRESYTNEFWEWDQPTNVWIRKADFGGTDRGEAVGFSIGTKGYIGTGYNYNKNTSYNDFWEWDQATNVWTRKADFGGMARNGAVGFSIGNRGYIGTGSGVQDFWEYDPLETTVITQSEEKNSFVYPNPASYMINLNLENIKNTKVTLNIYNATGEVVRSELLKQNQQQINVADLKNGIYMIELKSNTWSENQKLIIQR